MRTAPKPATGRRIAYYLSTLVLSCTIVLPIASCTESGASDRSLDSSGAVDDRTQQSTEWISIWDGETFDGWRVNEENPESFRIEDGKIVANGPRAHLFYDGPVVDADFDSFEFRAEVYTFPNANSGIYYYTEYQPEGWPDEGYEAQINATHSDPRKTGSLYGINDVMNDAPHEDEEWFTYHIVVDGREITHRVDGETVMQYTVPTDAEEETFTSGTIALQAHDPESRVHFRDLEVRVPGETD